MTGEHMRMNSIPNLILRGSVLLVVLLLLVTPLYLIIRTAEAGSELFNLFFRWRNAAIWGRTILLCVSVTAGTTVIAVPLAWLIERTDIPLRRFWSITAALPLVIPSYVYAYLFIVTFGPKGTLQQWLQPLFGIERLPEIQGFWGAFIVLTLIGYPYTYLSVRAALRNLDPNLAEAARSLGLTTRQALWQIELPQLRPAIVAGGLLVALYALRDFGAVTMLRYSTFTRVIYIQYQSFFSRSQAAALAFQLVLIALVVLYAEHRTRGRARYQRISVGVARSRKPQPLGRFKIPALLFAGSTVLFALIIPAASLIFWVVRGLNQESGVRAIAGQSNVIEFWSLWEPALNSLTASGLAAIITVMAAIPVTILIVRSKSRYSEFVEELSYSAFALPGLVVALALVWFGANYALPLYQTLPLLLAGYVVLFIPQAIGNVRASLLQMSPHVEEAGRTLGENGVGVLRKITLPIIRPGLVAGGALVFLTAMKELPATLLLSPTGFNTLAVEVWTNISEAFFAQAALPTLLLLVLSSVPLAFLNAKN
jgi:iron(III) transport system permease protein